MRTGPVLVALAVLLPSCTPAPGTVNAEASRLVVLETEQAFAQTMADRNLDAFASFLSDEAVFFSGDEPLQGRDQVTTAWERFFDGPDAPFSWRPETVVVLESGALALSTGPVFDPEGNRIATFTSIWRLEEAGRWRIVFDRGCSACAE